ncbi:MAG: hypothetical protein HDR02_07750 [Lachnospiraceae bacterium]|nr:hypothetical protein [Lachnospiraceae bacterium]
MKDKRNLRYAIALVLCLLAGATVSCGKVDETKENAIEIAENDFSPTIEEIENAPKPQEESLCESAEEDGTVAGNESVESDDAAEADEVTRKLLCLKDGDTEPLVGVSFGEPFDYDKYVSVGTWHGAKMYRLKDAENGGIYFLFNGKGDGFGGLVQFANFNGGDFLGISVGEDSVKKISDVLGAYTAESRKTYSGTETWAIWDFETATLSVKIEDGVIQTMEYLAKGDIADAPELPEEETDFGRDRRETSGRVETVYNWSAYGSTSEGSYAVCDPRDVDYDENTADEFIREYLLSQGIHKEMPDRITYDRNGDVLAECYVDEEKGEYCIILHIWGYWLVDFDAGTRRYLDALYCTTHTLSEEDICGYTICEEDTEQGRVWERRYDYNRKKMEEAVYEYIPGTPFPFILESWNLDEFYPQLLIRNQKTWFFKEKAGFDEEGKFISYDEGVDQGEYLLGSCHTVYDEEGRLKAIQEELQKEDIEEYWGWWDESIDYSGQIEMQYRNDGTISDVEYHRSSYRYGTSDSSGIIEYDEKGRMLYNEYYITHGEDADIYLYEEDSDMPWCVIYWCCFAPGFEDIYLFLPQEP